ncbi:DUF7527 domain-containing protein [Natronorubrum sp. FCH18a]|uniref:DUF7527 domain-containing protein n=1 Tax=Natronorubrum sp. FCH18a TaxID=3447018 RepID=UPI003F5124B6
MDSRTQERAEQWDSRPFSGGYDGLTDLAASEFSGAVAAAGTWLFMLNGRIVGVVDGAIEDFENASGTVYEAPHPSLPLLCTMEAQGGETRAKYYTNETPLREVDGTLQDGSFTGYVELSENVLSGDYYAVYYGGRRMAAAYIGNAERLLTGDEAFDRADDEVGIYTVRDVDIDVTDVPGTGDADDSVGTSAASGSDAEADPASDTVADVDPASGAGADADPVSGSVTDSEPGTSTDSRDEPSVDPTESAIESIDLSGSDSDTTADDTTSNALIEDVAIDDVTSGSPDREETDGPSGITATDEATLDTSSSGITATESDPDAAAADSIDAEPEPNASVADESVSTSFDETATESAAADSAQTDPTAADSAQADPTAADAARTDPTAVPDATPDRGDSRDDGDEPPSPDETEVSESTSPDLAEVEAAAEQLDQNDISWTEDDVESSTEKSEPAAASDSPSEPDAESEQQADPEDERFEEEAQWRETRSIPSIDPDNSQASESKREPAASRGATERTSTSGRRQSESATSGSDGSDRDTSTPSADSSGSSTATAERSAQQHSAQQRQPQQAERAESGSGRGATSTADSSPEQQERIATLTQQLETLEEQRDALVTKAEELEAERDQLRSENQELSSTVDRLQSRIEELETELQRAREATASDAESKTPAASTQLPPQQALAETNLFVRYGSKSQPTLETAHGGDADRSEVASNLQLEHHTSFDAADVAVDGDSYGDFLPATMEYQFVEWLTETVLYEIRDTGNADALGDLYDAIPRIDRAELGASISLADDETEDVPDEVTFDVVAFDKMGNPLVVANLNDSREPATQGMLEGMEEAASAVKANYPDLAASIVVTSSYFEPGALEVAEQATGGGFLSRGSKLSYVSLSRKQGYHLCLVESRSEGFHMNVPEL